MARGHIKQRSPGSWSIVLSMGDDPITGKRKRTWRTVKGTKKTAQAEMTKLLAEHDRGVSPVAGNVKLAEWLVDWQENVVKHRNAPRTLQGYATICREHIVPALGNLRLHKLDASHVDRLMRVVLDKGRTANTASHVFTVLRKALNDAERRGLISRNPCRLTSPPRVEQYQVEQPSVESVQAVINEAKRDEQHGSVIEFMVRTGVRRGEAVALNWRNVHLDRGVVEIVESASRINGKGLQISSTKSMAGKRTLSLDTQTAALLRHWRATKPVQALSLGPAFTDQGFVFTNLTGGALDPDHLSHAFKRHARAAGHPKLRLHDLRHFHAFGLIASNAHPKIVQERLGHSSAAFTMQVYGHGSEELQREATERFAALLDA